MLRDGYHEVGPGKLATVITHLEMSEPPALTDVPCPEGYALRAVPAPDIDWYRDLYLRVGGQDWLWFSRLDLPRTELARILSAPKVRIFTLHKDGHDEAILELDFRAAGSCELGFFGVTPALFGTRAGRYMMNQAIGLAFAEPIQRFHVQTCTLDHPKALSFYRRSGFTPTRQRVEVFDDPRLNGVLPASAGPHIPIFSAD